MNLNKALSILELNYPFSPEELKKAYYRAALKHHPDRNNNNQESTMKFQEIQTANEYLTELVGDKEHKFTAHDSSYANILNNFIFYAVGNNSEKFSTIIRRLVSKCSSTISEKMIDNIDKKTLHKLYDYLCHHEAGMYINQDVVQRVREIIKNKIARDLIFTLNPSFNDLFQEKVFKLEALESEFFVPLWHDEIEYNENDATIIVKCIPSIPKHVSIDHNNDININISLHMDNIYKKSHVNYTLEDTTIQIPVKELLIKQLQTYVLKNKGIPKINSSNIYDTSIKGDIIFHISIK